MSGESMECRDFTVGERVVLTFLLRAARKDEYYISQFFSATQCSDMDDGGMGSIQFVSLNNEFCSDNRKFGCAIASCHFTDEDGVWVSVALYADVSGNPFELDVWKVDFSPLVRMPNDEGELVLDVGIQSACDLVSNHKDQSSK